MNKNLGSLYIVSTPIGNLNDITFRAIEVLNKVHICASEDTRISGVLFKKYNINTKLTSYHRFSEKSRINNFIDVLKNKKKKQLVTINEQFNLMTACLAADKSLKSKKKTTIKYL